LFYDGFIALYTLLGLRQIREVQMKGSCSVSEQPRDDATLKARGENTTVRAFQSDGSERLWITSEPCLFLLP
jgi:hypothetical protein